MRPLISLVIGLLVLVDTNRCLANNDNLLDSLFAQIQQKTDQRQLDTKLFQQALNSSDIPLQKSALLGLGRIGQAAALPLVTPMLSHSNAQIRQEAVLAVGLIGQHMSHKQLIELYLHEKNLNVQSEILLSLSLLGGNEAHRFLLSQLSAQEKQINGFAAQALGLAASWNKTHIPFEKKHFTQLLNNLSHGGHSALQTAFALTRIRTSQVFIQEDTLIQHIESTAPGFTQALLIKSWGQRQHKNSIQRMLPFLKSQHSSVRIESARALSSLSHDKKVSAHLLPLLKKNDKSLAYSTLQGLLKYAPAQIKAQAIDIAKSQSHQGMLVTALNTLTQSNKEQAIEFAHTLATDPRPYLAINAIQVLNHSPHDKEKHLLKQLTKSNNPSIAKAAQKALEPAAPKNSEQVPSHTINYQQALVTTHKKVRFKTNRGNIVLTTRPEAIYTSNNFIQLVTQGYYDGSIFSRVIANFVAQGGDEIGDGSGNAPHLIREEINLLSHQAGTVGMATSGKDTGSAQFFINLAPNLHLDRHYTVFAEVIEGMSVANQLQIGDWIIKAEIIDDDSTL